MQDDEPFVVRSLFDYESEKPYFSLTISTKRLLKNLTMSSFIHADSTYKLVSLNYPLLTCGVSDADRVFLFYFINLDIFQSKLDKF